MKRLTCEMCGGTDLMKQDGVFVCQSCGCKYSDEEYRHMIIDRMWDMICCMCERVPFSDWYYTSEPHMERFQNRTVQGGLFMPMLCRM